MYTHLISQRNSVHFDSVFQYTKETKSEVKLNNSSQNLNLIYCCLHTTGAGAIFDKAKCVMIAVKIKYCAAEMFWPSHHILIKHLCLVEIPITIAP